MTKFHKKKFSSPANSTQFVDNYDSVFGSPRPTFARPDHAVIADIEVSLTSPAGSAWRDIEQDLRARITDALRSHDPITVSIKITRIK